MKDKSSMMNRLRSLWFGGDDMKQFELLYSTSRLIGTTKTIDISNYNEIYIWGTSRKAETVISLWGYEHEPGSTGAVGTYFLIQGILFSNDKFYYKCSTSYSNSYAEYTAPMSKLNNNIIITNTSNSEENYYTAVEIYGR